MKKLQLFLINVLMGLILLSAGVKAQNIATKPLQQNHKQATEIQQKMQMTKIPLTQDELDYSYRTIESISDVQIRERVKSILNEVITENNKLDILKLQELLLELEDEIVKKYDMNLDEIKNKAEKQYESLLEIKAQESDNTLMNKVEGGSVGYSYGNNPTDNFTIFEPPFEHNCYCWGNSVGGLDDEAHECSQYTGAIGTYAAGFIGGATAEAMQRILIYVGTTKNLEFDATIFRTGGAQTLGFGAFAGTEVTWFIDDNYYRADVDQWWNWDRMIGMIITMVNWAIPGGGQYQTIKDAIEAIDLIQSIFELMNSLQELITAGDADLLQIQGSFLATPGYHYLKFGLRSSASGFVTGSAFAVSFGQVVEVKVFGITPPDTPNVNGDAIGYVGIPYEISFYSEDPNGDDIQYEIDWGNGDITDWTSFFQHGAVLNWEHIYSNPGYYTIRIKARDRDLMESDDWGSYEVHIIYPDITSPETWIDSGPNGFIDYNDVSFTWSGWDAVTPPEYLEYSYQLVEGHSGGTWSSWTSSTSKAYNNLSDNTYTFLVKARDLDYNEDPSPASRSFTIYTGPSVEDEWPMIQHDKEHTGYSNAVSDIIFPGVKWTFNADEGFLFGTSPVAADIVGDNSKEIVIGDEDGNVYCLDGSDGSVIWTIEIPGVSIEATPAIGNVYGDSDLEILVTGWDGHVYCLDKDNGNIIWTSDYLLNSSNSSPVIGYLDSGEIKVIIGSHSGAVFCLSGLDGHEVWNTFSDGKNDPPLNNKDNVGCSCAIGNVDGGSDIEVIALIGLSAYCFDGATGDEKWKRTCWYERGESHRTIGDLDNDGNIEIVFGSTDGYIFCLNGVDGSIKWQKPSGTVYSSPAIGNVDSDFALEVIVSTSQGNVICYSGDTGNQKWISDDYGDFGLSSPAIVDIDGDGDMEIIVADGLEGNVKCFEGNSGDLEWESEEVCTCWIDSSPAIGDIDYDNMVEIVIADECGAVVCVEKGLNDPPILTNGGVDPSGGSPSMMFDFSVHYFDANAHEPTIKTIVIDGTSYPMSGSGSDSYYTFSQSGFSLGNHHYHFYFEDGFGGTVRLPPLHGDYRLTIYSLHTISFHTDPNNSGFITFDNINYYDGQGTQKQENTYDINANPYNDFEFEYWLSTGGVCVSYLSGQSTSVTIIGEGTLTAYFNRPPNAPINPSPANNESDIDIYADLTWTGGDPDDGDNVCYNVYFGITSPPPIVSYFQTDTIYNPDTMTYGQNYYWQIVSWDNHGEFNESSIWEFTTEGSKISIPFESGWNWFSINLTADDMSIDTVLNSLTPNIGDYIKCLVSSATYYGETVGWWGTLDTIMPGVLYKISLTNSDTIVFSGIPVKAENTPIIIYSGWNWIGYIPESPYETNYALSSLNSTENDYIKNMINSSTYYDGYGWWGTLDTLRPLEGYMLKVTNSDTLSYPSLGDNKNSSLIYPVNEILKEYYKWDNEPGWNVVPNNFEFNGEINARIYIDNIPVVNGGVLAAFSGDECRGISVGGLNGPDGYVYMMMCYSNNAEGEILSFKFYDTENDIIYNLNETIEFFADMQVSNAFAPFEFLIETITEVAGQESTTSQFALLQNIPNPFSHITQIVYIIPEAGDVFLKVYNSYGEQVTSITKHHQSQGTYKVEFDGSLLPTGIYLYKLEFTGESLKDIKSRKMIISKH